MHVDSYTELKDSTAAPQSHTCCSAVSRRLQLRRKAAEWSAIDAVAACRERKVGREGINASPLPIARFLTANGKTDTHCVTLRNGEPNRGKNAGTPYSTVTWKEIQSLVDEPTAVLKDRARFVILSSYIECEGRSHAVQRERGLFHGLAVDIDKGNLSLGAVLEAVHAVTAGAIAELYSSSSATAEDRKWRVLIPLATPVAGADYADTQKALFALLAEHGIACDESLSRTGQPIYLPNVPPEKRDSDGSPLFYVSRHVDGNDLALTSDHPIVVQREAMRQQCATEKAAEQRRAARGTSKGKRKSSRTRSHTSIDAPKDPKRVELGHKGQKGLFLRRLDVLQNIRDMRGGWKVGTRQLAIHHVAIACCELLYDDAKAISELTRHVESMEQTPSDPFTLDDAMKTWNSTTPYVARPDSRGYRYCWRTIAKQLNFTRKEARKVSTTKSPIPSKYGYKPRLSRNATLKCRREALKKITARYEDDEIPALDTLRDLLQARGFAQSSVPTVYRDLLAIGRRSPRSRTGRPRRSQDGLSGLPNGHRGTL